MQNKATLLLVAPKVKFEWNSTSSGPTTPRVMWISNHAGMLPIQLSQAKRLRAE